MGHWRTKQVTIFLNNKCNMNCSYCYPGNYKREDKQIDIGFAKVGADVFFGEQNFTKLRFYAVGEPTLSFGLMNEVARYVKKKYPFVKMELQTNLLCSEYVAHWIGGNIDIVWISLDGPPDIQNAQRPAKDGNGSYDIIERNIKLLQNYNITIGIRPTITSQTIFRQKEIIEHVCSLGIRIIYFHHLIEPQNSLARSSESSFYKIDIMEYVKEYVRVYKIYQNKGIFLGNFFTINFDEQSKYHCRACLPAPQLTVDGYITSCDKGPYGGDLRFRHFIYGKYDEEQKIIDFFPEKIDYLKNRNVDNMEPCKDCSIKYNCGGGCAGESNFLYGDIYRVIPQYCKAVKYLAKYIPRNTGVYPYLHP